MRNFQIYIGLDDGADQYIESTVGEWHRRL